MKIIITGATGFIGRNLSESFHKEGIKVIATGHSLDMEENCRNRESNLSLPISKINLK